MPSHHRRRINKGVDDDELGHRVEESHAESYSRPDYRHAQTSTYRRTDSTSSNMSRASSSRTQRDSNWRPRDTEHRYSDDYYRERREDFDVAKSREPESWPARSVPEPRYSERDWSQRYEETYSTSTYAQQSSWGIPANTALDHRNGHQERWQSQDTRGHTFKGRPPERTHTDGQRRDWGREQRRGKDDQKWAAPAPATASGSGWDSSRGETRGAAWVEPRWNPPPEKAPVIDSRAWEPAPTWQPSGSGERQIHRHQNGPRSDYDKTSSASGRRGVATSNSNPTHRNYNYTNNKPQRDWRNDNGDLNKCVPFWSPSYVASNAFQLVQTRESRVRKSLGIFTLSTKTPPLTLSFPLRLAVACRIVLLPPLLAWSHEISLCFTGI
ncbi:hypothetical protein C8R44DRAFT_872874 [Mycena epipterygia]|nr:hypothetical protein C8R44DRAFT_872874 [Mycena epipterygia]